MGWLWVVVVVAVVASVLGVPIPEQQQPTSEDLESTSHLQTQAQSKQFEGSESNLRLEGSVANTLSYLIGGNINAVHLKEDKNFDLRYNKTHRSARSPHKTNCTAAPDCDGLNRHQCFATPNTCGTCMVGFSGEAGDSNGVCLPVNCSRAPACEQLNRHPCHNVADTCGACFEDFYVPQSTWTPFGMDLEPGNTPCLAIQYRPVVVIHGLGDTYNGILARFFTSNTQRTFHIIKTFSAEPGGAVFSATKPLSDMVEEFVDEIRALPSAKRGFNLIGISQGGLIARAYVEKYNDPPVYNFVGVHAPMSGIQGCPGSGIAVLPCQMAVWYGIATPHDYWRGMDHNGVFNKETYLSWNNYLQDLNNEGAAINETYRQNMISLNRYVLVKAAEDRVVIPSESEWHGYIDWNDTSHTLPMESTDEYKRDVIGLKTLNSAGKIAKFQTPGGHVQVSADFWETHIDPYFANGWYQDGSPFDQQETFEHYVSKHAAHAH